MSPSPDSGTGSDSVKKFAWVCWLNCGHYKTVYSVTEPLFSQGERCYRCRVDTFILETNAEYRSRCLDCTSSKGFGTALLAAQMFADKHHRRKPLHRVQIRRGPTVVEVRVPKRNLEELPFGLDEPPF